jgi:hypothetical protein
MKVRFLEVARDELREAVRYYEAQRSGLGKEFRQRVVVPNRRTPVASVAPAQKAGPSHQFECPFCHTHRPPLVMKKISTAGWIVFVLMLILCFPLCFVVFSFEKIIVNAVNVG